MGYKESRSVWIFNKKAEWIFHACCWGGCSAPTDVTTRSTLCWNSQREEGGSVLFQPKGRVCALSGKREKEEKKLFFWMYIKSGYMLLFSPTLDWFENDGTSQLFITEIEWGEEEDVNRSGVAHEWRQDRSWQKANSLVPEGPIRLMAFLLSCWHITATRLREN